jgi:hypothetical protein
MFNRQARNGMWKNLRGPILRAAATAIGVAAAIVNPAAQSAQKFTATAAVQSPKGTASMPVTITIDRFVSDADRDRILGLIKANDREGTKKALAAMDDIGSIAVAQRQTPIKFAYERPSGGGRLITIVTSEPILFLGGAAPDAPSREGFDLALALLVLDGQDSGSGELAPAAKVKVDDSGAVVTDDYGKEMIHLTGIAKAK